MSDDNGGRWVSDEFESEVVASLQRGVQERQDALREMTIKLSTQSDRLGRRASVANLVLIGLGVAIAARAAVEEVFDSSRWSVGAFALAGLLVAGISALEAVFGWQRRAAKLTVLASMAMADLRRIDSMWRNEFRTATSLAGRIDALNLVLGEQDGALHRVESGATELGITPRSDSLDPQVHSRPQETIDLSSNNNHAAATA